MGLGHSAPDVAVVGAGLVGLCCALSLQRAGLSTLLIDSTSCVTSASFGNAGHIAVEQVQPLANPAVVRSAAQRLFAFGGPVDFRLLDASTWAGWALRYLACSGAEQAQTGEVALSALLSQALPAWRRLVHEIDRPDLLIESGHLIVWEEASSARAGRARWAGAATGEAKLRDLHDAERAALETALGSSIVDGVGFDGTAQVASPALIMDALGHAFLDAGGQRLQRDVRRLRCLRREAGLELDDRDIRPRLVVVAAGVGSGSLLRGAGHIAPVVAERGYHIEAETEDWGDLPPVVFEDRSLVVTRFGSRLRATSFVEFADSRAPADPRKWARLEQHARALKLPMRGEFSRWMGARPTLPDYLPAIGRSQRASNLIYAFGHQHLGLTLAPLTGELVADLAQSKSTNFALQAFDLDRFTPSQSVPVWRRFS